MLRSTVQSLIAGGSAQPGELLQADQEALALQDRRDELNRDVAVARAKLRRWIGNEADQPLQGGVPSLNLVAPHLQQRIASHPESVSYTHLDVYKRQVDPLSTRY